MWMSAAAARRVVLEVAEDTLRSAVKRPSWWKWEEEEEGEPSPTGTEVQVAPEEVPAGSMEGETPLVEGEPRRRGEWAAAAERTARPAKAALAHPPAGLEELAITEGVEGRR
jgi:hypothetical protein